MKITISGLFISMLLLFSVPQYAVAEESGRWDKSHQLNHEVQATEVKEENTTGMLQLVSQDRQECDTCHNKPISGENKLVNGMVPKYYVSGYKDEPAWA